MNLKDLPIGDRSPEEVHCIVEIPAGSRNKYEFDPELNVFRLDRVLYSAVHYPTAYGFIPSTLYDDGDPADVLLLCSQELVTGVMVDARPIGLLRMRDDKGLDDKILCVAVRDEQYRHVMRVDQISHHLLVEIEHFFQTYKQLEGKKVSSHGWEPDAFAKAAIQKSHDAYMKMKNGK